jgi:hypothetical protein
MQSMGLLGDEAHVEARFGPFGDSATLDARLVHGLHRTYRMLRNSIFRLVHGLRGILFQSIFR